MERAARLGPFGRRAQVQHRFFGILPKAYAVSGLKVWKRFDANGGANYALENVRPKLMWTFEHKSCAAQQKLLEGEEAVLLSLEGAEWAWRK